MVNVALTTEFVDTFLQVASEPEETHPSVAADKESPGDVDDD